MSLLYRVVACLLVTAAFAQSKAFAKISIKPAHAADPRSMRVQILPNADLIATSVPGITLLSYAYGVPSNPSQRRSSLPGWAYGERYDIEAKAPSRAMRAGSSDGEAQKQSQQMLRR